MVLLQIPEWKKIIHFAMSRGQMMRQLFELVHSRRLNHASFSAHSCSDSNEFSCMISEPIISEHKHVSYQ